MCGYCCIAFRIIDHGPVVNRGSFGSLFGSIGSYVKHERKVVRIVARKSRIAKMFDQAVTPLNPCVCNLTNFLAVELFPILRMELLVEFHCCGSVDKVHECVAQVTTIFEIDGQIKEVKSSAKRTGSLNASKKENGPVSFVQYIEQHFLTVFVRYVANH